MYVVNHFILVNYDILIFHITVILYMFAGGYKCRLTTFPIPVLLSRCLYYVLLSLLCFNAIVVPYEQTNKYNIKMKSLKRCHASYVQNTSLW